MRAQIFGARPSLSQLRQSDSGAARAGLRRSVTECPAAGAAPCGTRRHGLRRGAGGRLKAGCGPDRQPRPVREGPLGFRLRRRARRRAPRGPTLGLQRGPGMRSESDIQTRWVHIRWAAGHTFVIFDGDVHSGGSISLAQRRLPGVRRPAALHLRRRSITITD